MVHFNPNIYQATPTFWGRLAFFLVCFGSQPWWPWWPWWGGVNLPQLGRVHADGRLSLLGQWSPDPPTDGQRLCRGWGGDADSLQIDAWREMGVFQGVNGKMGCFFSPKNCACRSCSHLESHRYQVRKERIVKVWTGMGQSLRSKGPADWLQFFWNYAIYFFQLPNNWLIAKQWLQVRPRGSDLSVFLGSSQKWAYEATNNGMTLDIL